jgi:hypothetical protein
MSQHSSPPINPNHENPPDHDFTLCNKKIEMKYVPHFACSDSIIKNNQNNAIICCK